MANLYPGWNINSIQLIIIYNIIYCYSFIKANNNTYNLQYFSFLLGAHSEYLDSSHMTGYDMTWQEKTWYGHRQ